MKRHEVRNNERFIEFPIQKDNSLKSKCYRDFFLLLQIAHEINRFIQKDTFLDIRKKRKNQNIYAFQMLRTESAAEYITKADWITAFMESDYTTHIWENGWEMLSQSKFVFIVVVLLFSSFIKWFFFLDLELDNNLSILFDLLTGIFGPQIDWKCGKHLAANVYTTLWDMCTRERMKLQDAIDSNQHKYYLWLVLGPREAKKKVFIKSNLGSAYAQNDTWYALDTTRGHITNEKKENFSHSVSLFENRREDWGEREKKTTAHKPNSTMEWSTPRIEVTGEEVSETNRFRMQMSDKIQKKHKRTRTRWTKMLFLFWNCFGASLFAIHSIIA